MALKLPQSFQDLADSLRPHTIVTVASPRLRVSLGPLELYRRIAAPHAFFIQGLRCGDEICALVGWNPVLRFQAKGRHVLVDAPESFRQALAEAGAEPAPGRSGDASPLQVLRILLDPDRYQLGGHPPLFAAAYGVVGYDAAWEMLGLPRCVTPDGQTRQRADLPDWHLVVPGTAALYHSNGDVTMAVNLATGPDPDARDLMLLAQSRLVEAQRLATAPALKPAAQAGAEEQAQPAPAPLVGTCSPNRRQFAAAVRRFQKEFRAGGLAKAILSVRVDVPFTGNPADVLERLLRINPSRCNYLLGLGEATLVGATPELLAERRGKQVTMRPLAGTRRRGATADLEAELLAELESSAKEQLEHRIAVAVAAADLGGVVAPGSLAVKQMAVDKYSHVMHLATEITAELVPHCDSLDLFNAVFPAGTVTGAPRRQAMQLIDAVEPFGRDLYAGAVACFQPNGDMESFITLRSVVLHQGIASVQAGAGIVAGSDPEVEYRECLAKAQAALLALGEVELSDQT